MKSNDLPMKDYQSLEFEYQPSPEQQASEPAFHPVVVVGAGPVGLSLAIDLAQRGIKVLLLDNDHKLSTGSRAICFAKRTLEIFDRLGCGDAMGSGRRGKGAENGGFPFCRNGDDRERRALGSRQVEVGEPGVVVDHVDAAPRHHRTELFSRRDVEDGAFALGASDE